MTFLNPFVLIGLAAASIPILLHIFSLRKLETIDFSTLSFLKELQKTKIRKLKLRQLLLLALRTLLIVLIVTAFSRPTLTTASVGANTAHAITTAVLIVDNSYSMTSIDGAGQLLKQAKEAATNILQLLKDGDEIFVIKTADAATAASRAPGNGLRDFAVAKTDIQSIEPSYLHATIEDALRVAARLLSSSKNLNQEVYVLSDFKTGGLRRFSRKIEHENILPAKARFYLIPLGKNNRENLATESVQIENALFGVGRTLNIKSNVRNWGMQDKKNDVISVFLNGTRVAQKALDIQAQNQTQTEFSITPTSSGYLDGEVEVQDDDLEFDNRRPFAVHIPQSVRVLLVGSPSDLRYVHLALSAQPVGGESIIKVTSITSERLSTNDIETADVVVIANVKGMSAAQSTQIRSFVERGGGLVFFPGSQVDSSSFTSFWTRTLDVPPISSAAKLRKQPGQLSSSVRFDKIDFRHPIFQGMFDDERMQQNRLRSQPGEHAPELESPTIYSHVQYGLDVRSVPIITLSDASPFLLEQKLKRGVEILFGVSATTDFSDLPLQGLFVPMIHSSITYASQRNSLMPEYNIGDEADLSLGNVGIGKVTVQNPDKSEIACGVMNSDGQSEIRFRETMMPGVYSVKSGNTVLKQFVVNIDPAESNTTRASDREIEALLGELGASTGSVRLIARESDIQETVVQSRIGIELWKYFIAAALFTGLVESLVARTAKQELGPETILPKAA